MDRIKSNLKRCPLIKITRVSIKKDEKGDLVYQETSEEFNDCYRDYCMAWDPNTKTCTYFQSELLAQEEEDEDDED